MLFPNHIIKAITDSAIQVDSLTRDALANGIIADENDYTSCFIKELRDTILKCSIPGLRALVVVLKAPEERRLGADAKIVLANSTHFKVCVFEAKWPRLKTPTHVWDSKQAATGGSHFHDQLKRQSSWANKFAIWEMFYCEWHQQTQPSYMSDSGSSCVWHEHAFNASNSRQPPLALWNNNDLQGLLSTHRTTIDQVLDEVCRCQKGKPKDGDNYEGLLSEYSDASEYLVIRYVEEGA